MMIRPFLRALLLPLRMTGIYLVLLLGGAVCFALLYLLTSGIVAR